MISGTNTISHAENFSQDLDNLLFYTGYDNPYTTESIIQDKYLYHMKYFDGSHNPKDEVNLEEVFLASSQYEFEKQLPQTISHGPMDSAWPMFCHDRRHTGQSPYSTKDNPGTEKWRFLEDRWIEECPIIDNDGIIYIADAWGDVLAVYPNGTMKWKFTTEGQIWGSSTAIDENGTIYIGSWDDYFYAIYPNGTLKWRFHSGGSIASSPAIADDGTIYFGTMRGFDKGDIFAVNPNGTEKWCYTTGYYIASNPAIGDDGIIYIGSGDSYLYAMYPNGTLRWRFNTGDEIHGHPSIADDGTIYIGSNDEYLYAIYPNNGTEKWRFDTTWGLYGNPSVANDGTIYIGTDKLYAIYPNGTLRWSFVLGYDEWVAKSSPAISSEGTIYIGTHIGSMSGGDIVAVNPDGTERWRKRIASEWVESSPSIGEDGTIYIGSSSDTTGYGRGCLHAFGRGELIADAGGPYNALINEDIQFSSTIWGGIPPYEYLWYFGDGDTSVDDNPVHSYPVQGNYSVTLTVTDAEDNVSVDTTMAYVRSPPSTPDIDGPASGHFGEEYDYTFTAVDPENDDIWYYVDWGDDSSSGWLGPYSSGEAITLSHIWEEQDTYTLRCRAKDILGGVSEWGTLEVTMPVNQQSTHPMFYWFLERFPNAFPILRQIFGL